MGGKTLTKAGERQAARKHRLQASLQEGFRYILGLFMESKERREHLLPILVLKAKESRKVKRDLENHQKELKELEENVVNQKRRVTKAETFWQEQKHGLDNAVMAVSELSVMAGISEAAQAHLFAVQEVEKQKRERSSKFSVLFLINHLFY